MSVHAKKMQLKVSDGGSLNGDILKNGNNEYLIDEEKEPYRFKAKQMDHSSKKDINQMNLSLMIPPPSSHQRTSEISPRESTLKRFLDEKVPLLPIRLMEDSNEVDLLKSAENLLQNFFPSSRHNTTFDWTPCNDGITNKLLKCRMKKVEEETTNEKQNEVSEKTVLVKIYGKKSEFFIDRDKELLNYMAMSRFGFVTPPHGRFLNGYVYDYCPGRTITLEEMQESKKMKLVAKGLAKWHALPMTSTAATEPSLLETLKKFIENLPSHYEDPEKQLKFETFIQVPLIHQYFEELKISIPKVNSPSVFCHNDLLSANIIFNEDADFEYGGYNYRGYDIANHFCEFVGFTCDWNLRFPTKEKQLEWLSYYLRQGKRSSREFQGLLTEHHTRTTPTNSVGRPIASAASSCCLSASSFLFEEDTVESLYEEVQHFILASHLFWSCWALHQAAFSDIQFDFMTYSAKRLEGCKLFRKCF